MADERHCSCFRSALLVILLTATALSIHGFWFGNLPGPDIDMYIAKWACLLLAATAATSLVVYDRLPDFRICAFVVPTIVLGLCFIVLDYRTRLGYLIVVTAAVAGAPMVVLEFYAGLIPAGAGCGRAGEKAHE